VFKPFVYAAAYEERKLLPQTMVSDNRIEAHELSHYGLRPWSPRNSDGTYRGWREAEYGLEASRNTMTVRVGERAGLAAVRDLGHAANLGDPKRDPLPESPVLYIGAFEAPLLNVASAYSAFANDGIRSQWHLIDSIVDRGGERLDHIRTGFRQRLLQPGTAAMVTEGLESVMRKGTGSSAKRLGWEGPAAGKTGTTDDYRDAWFLGYSSALTCGVWVGLDNNQPVMPGGYGSRLALPIWVDVMKAGVEHGYEAIALPQGPERVPVETCRGNGDLATMGCRHAGTVVTSEIPEDLIDGRVLCRQHATRAVVRGRGEPGRRAEPPRRNPTPRERGVLDRVFGWFR
jgi:penicillin-binding protein 1A